MPGTTYLYRWYMESLPLIITTMAIELKDINTINYINFTMKEVNDLTDDIYEAMIDSEHVELNKNIDALIKILNEIKKTHKK